MNDDMTINSEMLVPYQKPQVPFMAADLVLPGVLNDYLKDDRLWVPVTETLSFKPLLLNTTSGYYINLLSAICLHSPE
jgi:hypothetical protein